MELDAEGDLDKTDEQLAADQEFDRVIDQAAAGDFEALGWSTAPLVAGEAEADAAFVPTTIDDFLHFTS